MNKKQIIAGLILALALVVFLKKDYFFGQLPRAIFGSHRFDSHVLQIVLNTATNDLSPYSLNLNDRTRAANIYQGLVAFDPSLKIVPALAVSWGNIDPVTWEFKLRREVLFHDGTPFAAQDVVDSFERAKQEGGGEIKSLLSSIDKIEIVDPRTIRVITDKPDPLLLSKLTSFLISKTDNVGTGSYKLHEWVKGDYVSLTAFLDYWGALPTFKNVHYRVTENKGARQEDFDRGDTDILASVPRDQAITLGDKIKQNYSLEVNFLMFNLKSELMKDRALREKIRTLFDPAKIEEIGNHFVRPVSQFVAPGVFGYNDDIPAFVFDPSKKATDLFGGKRKKIVFDYPETYETLVQYLHEELRQAGFSVELNPLPPAELLEDIRTNKPDLFLIGWQAENGDAGDFLNAFIHSQGEFNQGRYSNADADKLIEQSRVEVDPPKRLKLLQEIMTKVDADLIGIPLFESTRLYAVRPGVTWEPRLDGLVLAGEVR